MLTKVCWKFPFNYLKILARISRLSWTTISEKLECVQICYKQQIPKHSKCQNTHWQNTINTSSEINVLLSFALCCNSIIIQWLVNHLINISFFSVSQINLYTAQLPHIPRSSQLKLMSNKTLNKHSFSTTCKINPEKTASSRSSWTSFWSWMSGYHSSRSGTWHRSCTGSFWSKLLFVDFSLFLLPEKLSKACIVFSDFT